jgi:hypothetical protein
MNMVIFYTVLSVPSGLSFKVNFNKDSDVHCIN